MGIIAWIFVGLIAGALGKFFTPGDDPDGFLRTIFIGICGGIVGGTLGEKLLGWNNVDGFNIRSIAIATIGSVIVLVLWKALKKKSDGGAAS
ncbi:MAG: GlsB/YeaQ/YmgE family stress response membrane protein [Verrucomicrobiaceae bacterium]|nr:GlsB/YeaQ/YmgE family stress response membrane protein [Verrucomicrobiaceae bacterium]